MVLLPSHKGFQASHGILAQKSQGLAGDIGIATPSGIHICPEDQSPWMSVASACALFCLWKAVSCSVMG